MSTVRITPLGLDDLPEVERIEGASFAAPWPPDAYRTELTENRLARYVAARDGATLVGFAGIWLMVDEAHVATIAVEPSARGRGIGTLLLLALLEEARRGNARVATLDVRVSNLAAQGLYARLGFVEAGRRRRYYDDNREDALIMTTAELGDPRQRAREALARANLAAGRRLPDASAFDAAAEAP